MPIETREGKINAAGEPAKAAEPAKKIYIDLEGVKGSDFPKPPRIPEDSYDATIVAIEMNDFPTFDKKGRELKFIFSCLLDYKKDNEPVTLPHFVRAVVTKAYEAGKNNSNLYDIIVNAGLMDAFHKNYTELELPDAFRAFISGHLVGRACRVQVGIANKNIPDKEYSKVEKILRFKEAK